MKAYRITDWKELYEVTTKGKPANADTKVEGLRKSKLPYIRWQVHGRSLGPTYRKMVKMAWGIGGILMEAACMGIFGKLLELAGDWDDPQLRGWILDEKKRPINAPQIADLLDIQDDGTLQKLLDILCHEEINWLELVEFPLSSRQAGEKRGEKGKVEEPFKNETEALLRKANLNETERDSPCRRDKRGRKEEYGGEYDSLSGAPASALDSESASDISDSDSGSAPRQGPRTVEDIRKESAKAVLQVAEIIRPKNNSDLTTLNDIFVHLQNRMINDTDENLFALALAKAKECWRAQKPIAMFVASMKKSPFFYQPKGISVVRGKLDHFRKDKLS